MSTSATQSITEKVENQSSSTKDKSVTNSSIKQKDGSDLEEEDITPIQPVRRNSVTRKLPEEEIEVPPINIPFNNQTAPVNAWAVQTKPLSEQLKSKLPDPRSPTITTNKIPAAPKFEELDIPIPPPQPLLPALGLKVKTPPVIPSHIKSMIQHGDKQIDDEEDIDISFPIMSEHVIEKRGFYNLGNTCYLSATFQMLLSCHRFFDHLRENKVIDTLNEEKQPVLSSIVNYIKEIRYYPVVNSYNYIGKPYKPSKLFESIKDPRFNITSHIQQDCHEFLLYLLSRYEEETIKSKPDNNNNNNNNNEWVEVKGKKKSVIRNTSTKIDSYSNDIFQIILRNEKQKNQTKGVIDFEYLYCLSLPIIEDELYNIEDALYYYMIGDNINVEDKSKPIIQRYKFEHLPPILLIHLMRFNYLKEYGTFIKITRPIEYKLKLTIPTDYCSPNLIARNNNMGVEYKLQSVICHLGEGFETGHYVTYIQDINRFNYIFNDTEVRCVNLHQFLDNSTTNYILCYGRVDN